MYICVYRALAEEVYGQETILQIKRDIFISANLNIKYISLSFCPLFV